MDPVRGLEAARAPLLVFSMPLDRRA